MQRQTRETQDNKTMKRRINAWRWRMNCCGIFCDPQKGSESKGKVCRNLPAPRTVSYTCHVLILCSVQKRLLQLCKSDEPSWKGYCARRDNPVAASKMLSYIRIPADVAMAGKEQGNPPQSENHPPCHKGIRLAGWNSSPQEVAANRSAAAQIRKSTQLRFLFRNAKLQIGDRYFLYSIQTGRIISLHDLGLVWQQHCSLQDRNIANGESGAGHHPPGSAQRKEEGRRGVTTPQRPRLSIHIPSIFQDDETIRHYAFDVKTLESLRQRNGGKFLFHSQNRMHLPPQTSDLLGSERDDWPLYPFLQLWAHPKQNRNGAANAAPFLLKLNIPTPVVLLYCLHKLVRFKAPTLWSGLWPLMGLFRICVHCLCHTEQPEQLCAAVDVEFVVKAGGVHFYGGFGEAQLPRDLPPNFGGQQEYGYLLLPGR